MRKLIILLSVISLLTVPVYASVSSDNIGPVTEAVKAEVASVEEETLGPTPLSGNIVISYSPGSGRFSVSYSGSSSLQKGTLYTWFKGSSSVSTMEDYRPPATGTYYCVVTNDNYSGDLKSNEITLYQAKGKDKMTFSNEYGLYPKGASVSARVKLEAGEKVVGWTTNVKGVAVPSSGNPITFTMPAQDITIKPEISREYSIKISGGTADKYSALPDEIITIRANKSKNFKGWKTSGGSIEDKSSKVTRLKMPKNDVTIEAEYKEDKSSSSSTTSSSSSRTETRQETPASVPLANAVNAVYEVINGGGFQVDVRHAVQGPLCDRAFRIAQGNDWLVTDYFNITINGSYEIYELPSPIRLKLTIPADLQKQGRSWRMLCISRGGMPYSFLDEDNDDSTITFSPDRFYAYAMVYNDAGFSTVAEPVTVSEPVTVEEPPAATPVEEHVETSSSHNVDESQTITSRTHSVTESATFTGEDEETGTIPGQVGSLDMDSDKSSAIRMAHGMKIPTFQI